MLRAQNLHITFNGGTPIETRALRGMTLAIPERQFVTVIGSNGAGKSTFLNAISGDIPVDSGTIAINDVEVTRQPVWQRASRVARVFQDPMAGTCEDLTIEENMALAQSRGLTARPWARRQAKYARRFSRALGHAGPGLGKPFVRSYRLAVRGAKAGREFIDGFVTAFAHSLAR